MSSETHSHKCPYCEAIYSYTHNCEKPPLVIEVTRKVQMALDVDEAIKLLEQNGYLVTKKEMAAAK